jgi:hypothetical protein
VTDSIDLPSLVACGNYFWEDIETRTAFIFCLSEAVRVPSLLPLYDQGTAVIDIFLKQINDENTMTTPRDRALSGLLRFGETQDDTFEHYIPRIVESIIPCLNNRVYPYSIVVIAWGIGLMIIEDFDDEAPIGIPMMEALQASWSGEQVVYFAKSLLNFVQNAAPSTLSDCRPHLIVYHWNGDDPSFRLKILESRIMAVLFHRYDGDQLDDLLSPDAVTVIHDLISEENEGGEELIEALCWIQGAVESKGFDWKDLWPDGDPEAILRTID